MKEGCEMQRSLPVFKILWHHVLG